MAATPDLRHLRSADFEQVYEPAEDSFLLLDALEAERDWLTQRQPRIALEIGSGSGIAITFLGMLLPRASCALMAIDINERAVLATRATAKSNGVELDVIRTDLLSGLGAIDGKVDVALFNPPYVPTPDEEVGSHHLAAAWAGGERGRRVTDRLIPDQIARVLAPRGVLYLVAVPENDPAEISRLMARHGFHSDTVLARRAGREQLAILKFWHE